MAARSALVVVGWIEQRDEEVLTGRELDLFAQQVEDDEERPSRDFTLLGDAGPQSYEPPTFSAVSSTSTTVVTASSP